MQKADLIQDHHGDKRLIFVKTMLEKKNEILKYFFKALPSSDGKCWSALVTRE